MSEQLHCNEFYHNVHKHGDTYTTARCFLPGVAGQDRSHRLSIVHCFLWGCYESAPNGSNRISREQENEVPMHKSTEGRPVAAIPEHFPTDVADLLAALN